MFSRGPFGFGTDWLEGGPLLIPQKNGLSLFKKRFSPCLIIRASLHLKEGDQFIVIGQGDAVILKAIKPPSMGEFSHLLDQASDSKSPPEEMKAVNRWKVHYAR